MIDGFTYIGSCNCGGTKQLKYQRGNTILYYKRKRKTFSLKHNGGYLLIDQSLETVCEKLKSLGMPESVKCSSTS